MAVVEAEQLDQTQVDQFMQRLMGTLTSATTALMLSIGHRSGLFEAMKGREPASSQRIAEWAGLNERYVREWLGGDGHRANHRFRRPAENVPPSRGACGAAHARFADGQLWRDDAVDQCAGDGGG